jgi:phage terminase small subunit
LSARAQELWACVVTRATALQRRAVVQAALEALDRAEQARAAVERDGMTTTTQTTGAVHLHPLLRVEREARAQFAKLWLDLGLYHGGDASPPPWMP